MPRVARAGAVPPKTMTIAEAASQLGIGTNLAYRLAADGELPVVRLGKRVLVSRARLAEMIDGRPSAASATKSADVAATTSAQ